MPEIPAQQWVFRARAERVVDGDTLYIRLDQGLNQERVGSLRLLGVDAPETRGPTRAAGLAAAQFVVGWLDVAGRLAAGGPWPLVVQTHKSDDFGRYLSVVWRQADGRCLNDDLVAAGHAVPFP